MSAADVARVIQLILAPVVMVSSCAIVVSGLLQRYAVINDRLRNLARERLDLLRTRGSGAPGTPPAADPYIAERLQEIDTQLPDLLRRLRLAHNAVLCAYSAIAVFVVDMFTIALATLAGVGWAVAGSLVVFLCGTAVMLGAVVIIAVEVSASLRAVTYEVRRVSHLDQL